jgi:hypothetical protein
MSSDGTERATKVGPESALTARVRELQREIDVRDEQLEVRAAVIRRLRRELADARESYERVVHSRSYRLASSLRHAALLVRPRELLRAVQRRRQGAGVSRDPQP